MNILWKMKILCKWKVLCLERPIKNQPISCTINPYVSVHRSGLWFTQIYKLVLEFCQVISQIILMYSWWQLNDKMSTITMMNKYNPKKTILSFVNVNSLLHSLDSLKKFHSHCIISSIHAPLCQLYLQAIWKCQNTSVTIKI